MTDEPHRPGKKPRRSRAWLGRQLLLVVLAFGLLGLVLWQNREKIARGLRRTPWTSACSRLACSIFQCSLMITYRPLVSPGHA